MKKIAPLLLAAAFALTPLAAYAQFSGQYVDQGQPCGTSNNNAVCVSGLSCNYDSSASEYTCQSVTTAGQCATNTDCNSGYACFNGSCIQSGSNVNGSADASGGSYGDGTCGSRCTADETCQNTVCWNNVPASGGGSTALPSGGSGSQSSFLSNSSGSSAGINLPYLSGWKNSIIGFINGILVPVLMAVAFLAFLWGVYQFFILGADDPKKREEGRTVILYGVVGFAVILSVWGLVYVILSTFGFAAGGAAGSYGINPPTL